MDNEICSNPHNVREFLQPLWLELKGDIREFTKRLLIILPQLTAENQQLFLQMAIAIAKLPAKKQCRGTLFVESLVTVKGEPFVAISFGEERVQVPPKDAFQHAMWCIQAAEASLSDAFLNQFLEKKLGLSEQESSLMLSSFRDFREAHLQEK
jgi:hypothetical protein